ncbi:MULTISPECIES: hypothetical protein [unclassified Bradyrhizobium]|uniref:hypothetical protein n=1 Tax=unclassified Bradyrhizobium TaxID=2631580 RepID=UPI001FFBFA78|nr:MULTISPECIES: hypothetical protein [unclassified Bradyrhizobium]
MSVFRRRRLERTNERAAHVCRAAEPGSMGNSLDGQHRCLQKDAGGFDPNVFDETAGVVIISYMNVRLKLRGLMAARLASASTERSAARFVKAQSMT